MPIERFSFIELEKQIAENELDIDKIEFISGEIVRCRNAIQDVKCEAKKIEPGEVKLFVKIANHEKSFVELINIDTKTRRTATKKIAKICKKNLCEEYFDFLERAESLLLHYKTKLEMRATWNECYNNKKEIITINDSITRIVWKIGDDKLLTLFDYLQNNGSVAKYSKEEILVHFADEKQIPFCNLRLLSRKIIWLKSDSSFAVFVDELANRKAIDEENKYKIFGEHFCNKFGKPFKHLAQKKNNTVCYTEKVKWARKILDSVQILLIFIVTQNYLWFDGEFGEFLKSISEYIVT